jgi:hypothetical protein
MKPRTLIRPVSSLKDTVETGLLSTETGFNDEIEELIVADAR